MGALASSESSIREARSIRREPPRATLPDDAPRSAANRSTHNSIAPIEKLISASLIPIERPMRKDTKQAFPTGAVIDARIQGRIHDDFRVGLARKRLGNVASRVAAGKVAGADDFKNI